MKKILLSTLLYLFAIPIIAQEQQYKITLLRANPGDLLELIDVIKEDISEYESLGINKPYLLRHSQGDQWDLMLIYPIGSLSSYFSEEQMINRTASSSIEKSYSSSFFDLISFQEEAIVEGPDKDLFNNWFEEYNFFHIEIFTALAGKQKELLKQREMENVFYENLNRRPNFIFTRVFGPSWDIMTIGAYDSLREFAGDGSITTEMEDEAAKKAGFEGINYIGTYLRELLIKHNDTLANKVDTN